MSSNHSHLVSSEGASLPEGLEQLLQRRSAWPLGLPAPNGQEFSAILQAAACAPDHAGLTPWRFKFVRGGQRHVLLERVLSHSDAQTDEAKTMHGKYTAKLTTAPLVVVLAARLKEHPKAPGFEQMLTCGAAVMNMLNAAHLLGYHGFWSSTPGALGDILKDVMGFEEQDQMLGLLNLGTPAHTPTTPPRVSAEVFAQEWV
ncbi:nitroreductase family protein [Lampropedia puyangensis]|uniref:nitroreductase family protein n=1 Tax=Lampropedia puyangensis TaxID=1330072 RepID=UPI0013052803|nr:nitroreductase family protein [Lampropedia puyangensis]